MLVTARDTLCVSATLHSYALKFSHTLTREFLIRNTICRIGEQNRIKPRRFYFQLLSQRSTWTLPIPLLFAGCNRDRTGNEIQLVEAAFGRIKVFGGTARTVLAEPFVIKATFNYFREKDPFLVSAAERAMLHSDDASVQGSMWEVCMHLFSSRRSRTDLFLRGLC